ncbi:autotransporter [Ectopseudomonas mendocina DLHK]|nr:autotransporter [Pseudomonas mendocina DLHK]
MAPVAAIDFNGSESAGDAVIDNTIDGVNFNDQSTAGNATINNSFSGLTFFNDQSTAGSATIRSENGGATIFTGQSSAGNALIVSGEEGGTFFTGSSNGGTARLVAEDSGFVDFTEVQGPAGGGRFTVGSIEGNGSFEFGSAVVAVGSNNLDTQVIGSLSGDVDGTLIKIGSGTLTVRGENANSFASAIRIEGGLINFDDGDSLGSGGIVLDGGGLQWADNSSFDISPRIDALGAAGGTFDTNGNDVLLSGAIGGSGSLTKVGAGVLVLQGAASYSGATIVQAGTLRQGSAGGFVQNGAYVIDGGALDLNNVDLSMGSLSGSGGQVLLGSADLVVNQASNTSFAGSILGSGAFIKDGAGTLALGGSHGIAGITEVRGGTLAVNGSLLSAIQVQSGATLSGTGSVGNVLINAGGTLAPGNSIGTLNVDGDLVFGPNSVYQVETDAAGNADRVVVSGLASLAGAVQVLAENGSYAPSTSYNILSAGQLSGQFDSISSNLAFLTPSLSYEGNAVTLTLARNDTSFTSLARTPNQRAFAEAAERLDEDNEVYRTLLDLGEDEVADTFNKLSGDAHASIASSVLFDDLNLSRAPLGNLRRNLASPERALPYWVQVGGGRQRIDDDGNAGEIIQDHESMLLGGDWPVYGDWRLGGAFGFGQERLDVNSRDAKADSDSYRYALYGGRDVALTQGTLKIFGGGGYSQHQIDSRRDVRLIDGPERLTRQYDVNTAQGFGELAWHLKFSEPAYVEPFVGLLLIDQRSDSFSEKGGAAALSASSQRNELLSTSLGVRGQQLFQVAERDLLLNGSFTWRQINGDLRPELDLQLEGGDRFRVLGTELPRNSFLVELNADYSITPNIVLDIDYNGVFSDRSNASNIAFNLRWKM